MSLLDKARLLGKAKELADKAADLAAEHADQIKAGIDKAEGLADKATKGRFSSAIETVGDRAAGAVDTVQQHRTDPPAS